MQADSVFVCMYASYLYDLLQGTQPGKAVLLEQITGAVLNQHGEQAEPLKPERTHTENTDILHPVSHFKKRELNSVTQIGRAHV